MASAAKPPPGGSLAVDAAAAAPSAGADAVKTPSEALGRLCAHDDEDDEDEEADEDRGAGTLKRERTNSDSPIAKSPRIGRRQPRRGAEA